MLSLSRQDAWNHSSWLMLIVCPFHINTMLCCSCKNQWLELGKSHRFQEEKLLLLQVCRGVAANVKTKQESGGRDFFLCAIKLVLNHIDRPSPGWSVPNLVLQASIPCTLLHNVKIQGWPFGDRPTWRSSAYMVTKHFLQHPGILAVSQIAQHLLQPGVVNNFAYQKYAPLPPLNLEAIRHGKAWFLLKSSNINSSQGKFCISRTC